MCAVCERACTRVCVCVCLRVPLWEGGKDTKVERNVGMRRAYVFVCRTKECTSR